MREPAISQKARFALLAVETCILCLASWIAFGGILPPTGDKGFWFYTALLGLILGSRLDTPFFARPSDVVVYAAPAAIALGLSNHWDQWDSGRRVAFVLAEIFCITAGVCGAVAILVNDPRRPRLERTSNAARVLAETLGSPRVIYTVVIAFALYAFHSQSPIEIGVIVAAWAVTAVLSPLEATLKIGLKLQRIFHPSAILNSDGEVVAYQTPGLILVRRAPFSGIVPGDFLAIRDSLGTTKVALALDLVGRDDGVLLRTIELADCASPEPLQAQMSSLAPNVVVRMAAPDSTITDTRLGKAKDTLVGLVASGTSVETLFFEVVRDEALEEGLLVEVSVGRSSVAFQLVNGLTRDEIVQQKNTNGFIRAQAHKIGEWNSGTGRFMRVAWLPRPNAPVFLRRSEEFIPRPNAVGHFPGTDCAVSISDLDALVTHNTAILGILGVGKSMLAIELVERMMAAGIRVVCLDLTSQYASELQAYYNAIEEEPRLRAIQEAGDKDRDKWAEDPEAGGSLPSLRQAIYDDLHAFLDDASVGRLKIYNPAQFTGTRQVKEPSTFKVAGEFTRRAGLWDVTPVEVARIVTEATLALVQDRMSEKARVCLVFEEAHALVPEFNTVASQSDRDASNGTARAILQGRKFGLGCLLVTQRTANVTKTILNQCNTIFAMRTFDETGKEFLANYIGKDYSSSLSSIAERHAVIFGKASSCENPVLLRLNDRDQFRAVFRAKNPPPVTS